MVAEWVCHTDPGMPDAGPATQTWGHWACHTDPGMLGLPHRPGDAGPAAQTRGCWACHTDPVMPGLPHRLGLAHVVGGKHMISLHMAVIGLHLDKIHYCRGGAEGIYYNSCEGDSVE